MFTYSLHLVRRAEDACANAAGRRVVSRSGEKTIEREGIVAHQGRRGRPSPPERGHSTQTTSVAWVPELYPTWPKRKVLSLLAALCSQQRLRRRTTRPRSRKLPACGRRNAKAGSLRPRGFTSSPGTALAELRRLSTVAASHRARLRAAWPTPPCRASRRSQGSCAHSPSPALRVGRTFLAVLGRAVISSSTVSLVDRCNLLATKNSWRPLCRGVFQPSGGMQTRLGLRCLFSTENTKVLNACTETSSMTSTNHKYLPPKRLGVTQ